MALDILMTSGRIGSNPGGKGVLPFYGMDRQIYIKYCDLARKGTQALKAINQPIYEALTLVMAEKLGLHVPHYYVLAGSGIGQRPLEFSYEGKLPKLNSNKPYYFVSELVNLPFDVDAERLKEGMALEKVYRDMLLVSDVSNKNQNFTFFEYTMNNPYPHVLYIDMGCSFVDSVDGILLQRKGKKTTMNSAERRIATRLAKRYQILTPTNGRVSIADLIQDIGNLRIPMLNYKGKRTAKELLSDMEIEVIQEIFLANLQKNIHKHKRSPLIVR